MKRYGDLMQQVLSFGALVRASKRAARGKKTKPQVAAFIQNLENEVISLEQELSSRSYRPLPYRTFVVRDPKTRRICAADFRDRVVHHSLCAILEPMFERAFIYDTYACRPEKGTHMAVRRAKRFSRRHPYFLKLDIRKFFDSIDHAILKQQLRQKIKDSGLLWLLDVFIDHPVPWTESGKGIPIGNLTSQHFANFYLSGLDHYIKERLRIKGYIRYMDDFVLFADEKETLWDAARHIERFLKDNLHLDIKAGSLLVAPVSQGISFLGFRVFPNALRISRKGWSRFRRKVLQRNDDLSAGKIDEEAWGRSISSLVGHLKQADTRNLRASFFNRPGAQEAPTG